MRKRLIMLGFLILVSIGIVYVAAASGTLRVLALEKIANVRVQLQSAKLSKGEIEKAIEIAKAKSTGSGDAKGGG
jgi:hypothetical protein